MGSLKDKEDIADLESPTRPLVNTMFFWLKGKVMSLYEIQRHVNKRGNNAKADLSVHVHNTRLVERAPVSGCKG